MCDPGARGTVTILAVASLLTVSCGGGVAGYSPVRSPSPTLGPSTSNALQVCVDQTNQYRASVGRPALALDAALARYADLAARNDGTFHVGHQYFRRTRGGGIAHAENEIPWWPLNDFRTIDDLVLAGLSEMWREGRRGGHYRNMIGPYARLGCGIFVNGNEVTVVQAFR